jgi:hypothetical protein
MDSRITKLVSGALSIVTVAVAVAAVAAAVAARARVPLICIAPCLRPGVHTISSGNGGKMHY